MRTIMMVEDDPDDVYLFRNALGRVDGKFSLVNVSNGQELLEYLDSLDSSDSTQPHLILLDLNMPEMGGIEVLKRLSEDPDSKFIPVIIYSTSDNPNDVAATYEAGAKSYIVKPEGMDQLEQTVKLIISYWFEAVKLRELS